MNILIYSDIHILEKEIEECNLVLDEISGLIKKYKVDKIISAGDTFDRVRPTNLEINLFANFIKTINIPISIVVANSHESETPESSIFNHFPILKSEISICKEYIDEKHLYVGHFILKQSKLAFGGTIELSTLKDYKYICLGHQHIFEQIPPNAVQLGSCRFIDFAEVNKNPKVILLIENYKTEAERCHFIGLKSPYPMIDIQYSNLEDIRLRLDDISSKTKVRLKFTNFEDYKQWLTISKNYESKFYIFREKKDFKSVFNNQIVTKENTDIEKELEQWLKNQVVDEDVKKALLEEIK
ncbi:MAG: metallophosphoesterase [Patescibacteria group bacterium]